MVFAHRLGRIGRLGLNTFLAAIFCLWGGGAEAAGPQSILPAASTVKGWKQIGVTKLYNPSNLFDLVDGGADAVTAYAFVGCAHAEYAPAGQTRPVLTIDVYDMTDPLNAFGLFGSNDRTSGKSIGIGTEGVQIGPSGLNFWKGRYVVRMAIVQVSPATQAAMTSYARAIAAKITGPSKPPALVMALPPGRQPGSETYVRANVVSQSFLRNAIVGRYPSAGQGATLFLAEYPNPTGAKASLESYRAYERKGTGLTPLKGLGESAFSVRDPLAKCVVVAQKGRYVVGIVRARDPAVAQNLVRQAIAKVR